MRLLSPVLRLLCACSAPALRLLCACSVCHLHPVDNYVDNYLDTYGGNSADNYSDTLINRSLFSLNSKPTPRPPPSLSLFWQTVMCALFFYFFFFIIFQSPPRSTWPPQWRAF